MVASCVEDYGMKKDDILIDTISSLSNSALNVGEIIGPLFAGFASGWIGYNHTCAVLALSCFVYGIIYILGSGLVGDKFKKPKGLVENVSISEDLVDF
jgi:dipeptide/tripeptide permease